MPTGKISDIILLSKTDSRTVFFMFFLDVCDNFPLKTLKFAVEMTVNSLDERRYFMYNGTVTYTSRRLLATLASSFEVVR